MEIKVSGLERIPWPRIRCWEKYGAPEVIAERFGRKFFRQDFLNPLNEKVQDFYLFSMKDSVFVFPITEDGKVITVRQYKQGCHGITHELPAGVSNPNESPEVTVRRELLEETGYEAHEIVPLGVGVPDTRCMTIKRYFFLATGCKKVKEPESDPNEEIEVIVMDLNQWLWLIAENTVQELTTTSITLSALLHLRLLNMSLCDRVLKSSLGK